MIDSSSVRAWVGAYERVWRTAGTDQVAELFTTDATYQMSPFAEPHCGLDAIRRLWDAERTGPDEEFIMTFDVVAVDDPRAVVRLEVLYRPPEREHYRDLWILEFTPDGRCRSFEEWPFSP
ncbi:MAG: nuclear transport factor 2 family protein [Acidimicrobiia bacterium]